MKNLLLALSLMTSISAYADNSITEALTAQGVKTLDNISKQNQKELIEKSNLGLALEVGKLTAMAGVSCSVTALGYVAKIGTAAYISIEKSISADKTSTDKVINDGLEAFDHFQQLDVTLMSEDQVCIESAYKLRSVLFETKRRMVERELKTKK